MTHHIKIIEGLVNVETIGYYSKSNNLQLEYTGGIQEGGAGGRIITRSPFHGIFLFLTPR